MSGLTIKNITACCFCILLLACAKYTTPPTGGPEDKTPPAIVSEHSDANYQTNFNQRKIQFLFDEWITLSNAVNEVVISPPTKKPLIFSSRGKGMTIEFAEDEILKENATYQINFGNAVKDFSVGNIFENYVFVFSTGPVIDSLSVSGKVIDELTGEPVKDVLVMLYENLADSALILDKPFYFSKTTDDGSFQLNNLRADTFQLFGLKDENVSYTYDLPEERVAFYNKHIITSDTINKDLVLSVFDEADPPVFISRDHQTKGLIKLLYSNLPKGLSFEFPERDSVNYFNEFKGDTLLFWYRNTSLDSTKMIINHNQGTDTVFIKKSKRSFKDQVVQLEGIRNNRINLFDGDSLHLNFNRPLLSIDTSKFELMDTSVVQDINRIEIENKQVLVFHDLKAGADYKLTILPGGVVDWYEISNKDTIVIDVNVASASDLGKIQLNVTGTDSLNFILDLFKGNDILRTSKINRDQAIIYNRMIPGQYKLKIIQDKNQDGEWTAGKLIGKVKSEPIKEITLDELKKGWELSLDVDLKKIFNGTEID